MNPPGATPVLTIDQLWQGLEKKERSPQVFKTVFLWARGAMC